MFFHIAPANFEFASSFVWCCLGIIGCGDIGKNVVMRAAVFGMQILVSDLVKVDEAFLARYHAKQVPMEELLSRADYVTLHTDLRPESFHLMNAKTLRLMKPTAVLINASRGPCVSENDLAEALQAKVTLFSDCKIWWI